jgi:multisubunit Na+/H+ antiporter MnhC subunit
VTTTVDEAPGTPVAIGGTRGGPDKPTLRRDNWWVEPVVTVTILTAFVIYSTWAAFIGKDYYAGPALNRNLI